MLCAAVVKSKSVSVLVLSFVVVFLYTLLENIGFWSLYLDLYLVGNVNHPLAVDM
jgi:hypothetical protein